MNRMIKKMTVTAVFVSAMLSGYAMTDGNPSSNGFVVHGKVDIPECDSVYIEYVTHYFKGTRVLNRDTVVHVRYGEFEIAINQAPEISYINFMPMVAGRKRAYWKSRRMLPVSKGDSLTAVLKESNIAFSGRGAAKLNAVYAIESMRKPLTRTGFQPFNIEASGPNGKRYLEEIDFYFDSLLNVSEIILEEYRTAMTATEYDVIRIDLETQRNLSTLSSINGCLIASANDTSLMENLAWWFVKRLGKLSIDSFQSQLKSYTQYYSLFIGDYTYLGVALEHGGFKKFDFSRLSAYDDVYRYLRDGLTGRLRSTVLANMVYAYSNSGIDPERMMLKMALTDVQDQALNGFLTRKWDIEKVGSLFYNFSLTDTAGNTVSFDDVKGKVTLIDFWYTGCIYCAKLMEELTPFLDSLSTDPHFQLISVSVDKNMDTWLNSVRSGKYGHPSAINLFTHGRGSDDELLKMYDIRAYPRLLLIDADGKILDARIFHTADGVRKAVKSYL